MSVLMHRESLQTEIFLDCPILKKYTMDRLAIITVKIANAVILLWTDCSDCEGISYDITLSLTSRSVWA